MSDIPSEHNHPRFFNSEEKLDFHWSQCLEPCERRLMTKWQLTIRFPNEGGRVFWYIVTPVSYTRFALLDEIEPMGTHPGIEITLEEFE